MFMTVLYWRMSLTLAMSSSYDPSKLPMFSNCSLSSVLFILFHCRLYSREEKDPRQKSSDVTISLLTDTHAWLCITKSFVWLTTGRNKVNMPTFFSSLAIICSSFVHSISGTDIWKVWKLNTKNWIILTHFCDYYCFSISSKHTAVGIDEYQKIINLTRFWWDCSHMGVNTARCFPMDL